MCQKIRQDFLLGDNIRVSELVALSKLFQADYNAFFKNL